MGAEFYHCRLKAISRADNKSAVASAAYRAGVRLEDRYYGTVRDFSRKSDVVTAFSFAPEGAPAWATDTEALWNAVEEKENRKNSQLAFEWEVALPNELTPGEREGIARDFTDWLKAEYGIAGTVGIHEGGSRGNGLNDHMHVIMTTRAIDADGWGKKVREFATKPGKANPEVDRVREHVAELINEALEDAGSDTRVDHRSFKTRGIDREPSTHLGPAATAYERQGMDSDRGDLNREIERHNREVMEARVAWQAAEFEASAPEITPELEREFSARFGDWTPAPSGAPEQWRQDATGAAQQAVEVLQVQQPTEAEYPPGAPPEWHSPQAGQGGDQREQFTLWERFAARMQAIKDRVVEWWDEEEPDAEGGKWARLARAAEKVVTGWRHRMEQEIAEEVVEAVKTAEDAPRKPPEFPTDQPGGFKQALKDAIAQGPRSPAEQAAATRHHNAGEDGGGGDDARPGGDAEPPEPSHSPQERQEPKAPLSRIGAMARAYLAQMEAGRQPEQAGARQPDQTAPDTSRTKAAEPDRPDGPDREPKGWDIEP